MLINATTCCDEHTNEAIELLFAKAATDPPDPWEPHNSLYVQRLIELFTERGLLRIGKFQNELLAWLDNQYYKKSDKTVTKPGEVERRTPAEMALTRLYLESLPVDEFTFDDWMSCIDYLAQRYWPEDQIKLESEWLVTRSVIMGKVQARMADITAKQADKLLEHIPPTITAIKDRFGLSGVESAIMNYGVARCSENIVTVKAELNHRIKSVILDYKKNEMLGQLGPKSDLKTQLFDKFATANTDWRRIAISEVGEMNGQGVISSVPTGSRVKRIEQYKGACPFCRKIDGMEFEVISAADSTGKDPWKYMWPGKSNVGLSASPRKRFGTGLVPRLPEEMWVPTPGIQHPHCRGITIPLTFAPMSGDEKFNDWMKSVLEKK